MSTQGHAVEESPSPGVQLLGIDKGLRLLELMTTSRLIEDRIHSLYRQSRIRGRVISGRGQEAIPVGASYALEQNDVVAPVHRDLGAHLVRGTTALAVMLHYFGRAEGPSNGRDGDIHFGEWHQGVFPMVSHLPDSWPIVAGIGLSFALRREARVAMAFCGDGATSTGAWHEALNFASVFSTPTVFVVENNQYAYSTPTSRQYRVGRLVERADAYGIPGISVDGNDVVAVHLAARDAVERARRGEGPTLIEAATMRIDGHAIHDQASYVPEGLLEHWRKRDPIERLKGELVAAGVPREKLDSVRAKATEVIGDAVAEAEAASPPDAESLLEGVFSSGMRPAHDISSAEAGVPDGR